MRSIVEKPFRKSPMNYNVDRKWVLTSREGWEIPMGHVAQQYNRNAFGQ